MENIVIDYYKTLLTTQNPTRFEIHKVSDLISPVVDQDLNQRLDLPFSKEEVKKALFDLNPNKAPGPDGFTALFYQEAWDTVGEEMTVVILGILNDGAPLHDWNETVVTLIPKSKICQL